MHSEGKKIRVLMFPFSRNSENPYQQLIAKGLIENGVEVITIPNRKLFPIFQVLKYQFDILYLFWPEDFYVGKNVLTALIKQTSLLLSLPILRNKITIYSADNLFSHTVTPKTVHTESKWINRILKNCSGIIFSSEAAKTIYQNTHKYSPKNYAIVPHVSFSGFYPNTITKEAAKNILGLTNTFTFLVLGRISDYKGIEAIILNFNAIAEAREIKLLICGKCDKNYETKINTFINNNPKIVFINKYIKNEDVQIYMNGADALIVNYVDTPLNPGTLELAHIYKIPVIAPNQPTIIANYDPRLLFTYKSLDNLALKATMIDAFEAIPKISETSFIKNNTPAQIGKILKDFYHSQLNLKKNINKHV
ncbi:MAG TPA: glycosyltransferase [Chitinophagales bacterium]|nr:glycosyltransferase [Chitinophagales bacterium]HRG87092.1 glycosyltransferase [Chitinophagales bacterium]HRH55167.1 glycosyltransferase [Chitinophagales bacterium]